MRSPLCLALLLVAFGDEQREERPLDAGADLEQIFWDGGSNFNPDIMVIERVE